MARWTTQDLHDTLAAAFGAAQVEQVATADGALHVILPEVGDLGISVAISDRQLLVSTPLVDAESVRDRAAFDSACMRLNPINPLSNLGLTTLNGRDVYIVFGELAPDATAAQIELEIRTLADNAIDAIETLKPFLVTA